MQKHPSQICFPHHNHQLFFTLAIPSSPYTNNDNKTSTFNKAFEFPNGIQVEQI